MLGGNRIEDEVELPLDSCESVGVFGEDEVARPEFFCVSLFGGGGAEDRHFRSHRPRQLDPHVAQAAESDDSHFHSFFDAVAFERGVSGDSRTEQGGDPFER